MCVTLLCSIFCVMIQSILAALQENLSSGILTRSDTDWAVQPKKMSRGFKFPI